VIENTISYQAHQRSSKIKVRSFSWIHIEIHFANLNNFACKINGYFYR